MFEATIIDIYENIWPMLFIVITILVSIRVAYILIHRAKFTLYKELLMLLSIIYIMCLFYVVTFQDVSWSSSNFIPFREMFRYDFGSYMFMRNIAGNLLLFMPFGFFVSYFLKTKRGSIIFLLSLIASLTIETTQLLIGRVFDVDDIILNIVGGLIGFGLYYILDKFSDQLPPLLKKPLLYNIIISVLIIFGIIYIGSIIMGV